MPNNTLSPVFNVRGGKLDNSSNWMTIKFKENNHRNYINWNDENYLITAEKNSGSGRYLENSKGVIFIDKSLITKEDQIIGINFDVEQDVLNYLKDTLQIKGFFFVRQKRIPTTLCQAYTIGIDSESHTPVLPYDGNFRTESFLAQSGRNEQERTLTNEFNSRYVDISKKEIKEFAAICPEYDINPAYYNSLFNGSNFIVKEALDSYSNDLNQDIYNPRHYYTNKHTIGGDNNLYKTKILGVEDNVKLVAIDDTFYSARAGEAEEAFRYEYITKKEVTENATNLLRGSYGPYLGISGYNDIGKIIDIKIPEYSTANLPEYFKIRYNDNASYYAISDRYSMDEYEKDFKTESNSCTLRNPLYRGDCYICQFTHRVNRNFQDPSAPINDDIVDPNCWKNNYKVTDGVVSKESFENINLGDVNAVELGMWVTFTVRSTYNLCIRSLDSSLPDEEALVGHARGFYPYFPMSSSGVYKVPEALCYNQGFTKGLSERYNFEVPDVPFIKNSFTNRILYSNIQISDAFQNNFRVFPGTNYRDYPQTYGSITKIIELHGDLLCVYEHGIDLIPVQERVLSGEGSGGSMYINTSNVLPETAKNISDTFGSQWKDSIIKTPRGVYGVDTIGKKIWKTNGETFECISDFKVQEFLNQNISLTERELEPIIGIRNVKTHYNKFKGDVMFTFYDNLHGFEEKVWNLCWNENLQKWVTFYSWVPSYSENIYNQFFSFDRNTSKWISKLGISKHGSDFADGVTLENNIITGNGWSTTLHLDNRNLQEGKNVSYATEYELLRDNYGNHKLFELKDGTLKFIGDYDKIKSEFYERDNGKIIKDERGRRKWLKADEQINPDKVVLLLNIRAKIKCTYEGSDQSLKDAYADGFNNGVSVDSAYYESVVAVIPEYNMQFLTTDFWKHGQAGIIDIADKIYPTYWYGKQHPFEFEFVVADNPDKHKIFDSLKIISNKAAPESFHYEIIGECYDFAKDKKNMYIRQEATKELYQYNSSDIVFNSDYKTLDAKPRPLNSQNTVSNYYDKSTIFPLYYARQDRINDIEDYYHLHGHNENYGKSDRNFSALAGAEIVRYENLDEYRIWNHAKAVDIEQFGILRGNMRYKEDIWDVQINPINFVQKNEKIGDWSEANNKWYPPLIYNLFPLPKDISEFSTLEVPTNLNNRIATWDATSCINREAKLKDKFIKIRIRYSGKDLAIISAIKTLYSISYA